MSGRYLLDTNIVIALFAGELPVLSRIDLAESVFIPSIVLGELYFGAFKSARAAENVARVDELAALRAVLPVDTETARWYGQVKERLKRQGRPIPENDIWVAALARQHQLALASRDPHFTSVSDLILESW